MTATLSNNHDLTSNYKQSLLSLYENKKVWKYLNEQRKAALKRKKDLSTIRTSITDEVIYH